METETEPRKKICVDPVTYKVLEELATNKNMTVQEYADFLFKDATMFNSELEPDPSIDVQLSPEQHAKLRKWLDNNDPLEVLTGSDNKACLLNERQLWRKNHPNWKHDIMGELVQLRITVMSPFLDFIREYLRFFGSKDDLETFCMKAIYARVQSLNGDLEKFAEKHGLNADDWLERFNERTHGPDAETENDC